MAQAVSSRRLRLLMKQGIVHPMRTRFITDEKGKVLSAVVPIKEYEEMIEDLEDLAAVVERRNEETIPWEQVKKEMDIKVKGLVPS